MRCSTGRHEPKRTINRRSEGEAGRQPEPRPLPDDLQREGQHRVIGQFVCESDSHEPHTPQRTPAAMLFDLVEDVEYVSDWFVGCSQNMAQFH
ncbi:MAG: hypothetical protein H6720_15275 [Sandaracinus sp.]|nr:hypothetical protein [Sandaracinus sp.]